MQNRKERNVLAEKEFMMNSADIAYVRISHEAGIIINCELQGS